jgi:hypothetical protein
MYSIPNLCVRVWVSAVDAPGWMRTLEEVKVSQTIIAKNQPTHAGHISLCAYSLSTKIYKLQVW